MSTLVIDVHTPPPWTLFTFTSLLVMVTWQRPGGSGKVTWWPEDQIRKRMCAATLCLVLFTKVFPNIKSHVLKWNHTSVDEVVLFLQQNDTALQKYWACCCLKRDHSVKTRQKSHDTFSGYKQSTSATSCSYISSLMPDTQTFVWRHHH